MGRMSGPSRHHWRMVGNRRRQDRVACWAPLQGCRNRFVAATRIFSGQKWLRKCVFVLKIHLRHSAGNCKPNVHCLWLAVTMSGCCSCSWFRPAKFGCCILMCLLPPVAPVAPFCHPAPLPPWRLLPHLTVSAYGSRSASLAGYIQLPLYC